MLRDGIPVAMSDSDVDNLEHLSWTLERNGHYTLEVYRFAEGGIASEPFALAAQVIGVRSFALPGEPSGVERDSIGQLPSGFCVATRKSSPRWISGRRAV